MTVSGIIIIICLGGSLTLFALSGLLLAFIDKRGRDAHLKDFVEENATLAPMH